MEDMSQLRTSDEILNIALSKEEEAHQFYGELVKHCESTAVRGLVEKLKNEEYKHIRMVRRMITRLNVGRDPV